MRSNVFAFLATLCAGEVIYDMWSPNENVTGVLKIDDDGVISYSVKLGTETVIPFSRYGFELLYDDPKIASLYDGWKMNGIMPGYQMVRYNWEPIWGEESVIANDYNQLTIRMTQTVTGGGDIPSHRRMAMIHLRAYDIGVAVQMEFPEQPDGVFSSEIVGEDLTEIKLLPGDHEGWWSPADYDSMDYDYIHSKLRDIEVEAAKAIETDATNVAGSPVGGAAVQTPITVKTEDGIYLSISEAGGDAFSGLSLVYDAEEHRFLSHLTPNGGEKGGKGQITTPFRAPWKAIMVTRDPRLVLESHLLYNLNDEPADEKNLGWIKPVKSVGVWWELVNGTSTWRYTDDVDSVEIGKTDYSKLTPNGRHGATTENVASFIEFATNNNFDAVSFEGWNQGWENWTPRHISKKDSAPAIFDFHRSYPDFDQERIVEVATNTKVDLIKHFEVGSAIENYKNHYAAAFAETADLKAYSAIKIGYHGDRLETGAGHHTSHSMNEHYRAVIQEAANNNLSVSIHGGLKPSGLSRTYPNLFSATAGRTNAHTLLGISKSHTTILPFNHLIASPIEYGAGLIYAQDKSVALQLALLILYYSPNLFVAERPEVLSQYPLLLTTIEKIPTKWHKTRWIEAEIGQYVTVARQIADDNGNWFLAGITNTNTTRHLSLSLDFLTEGVTYKAYIFSEEAHTDGTEAQNGTAPTQISATFLKNEDLTVTIPPHSGFLCYLEAQTSQDSDCDDADADAEAE